MQTTTLVQPTAPRYVARQQGGTLRITLPSHRQWLALIFNGMIALVWVPAFLAMGGMAGLAVSGSAINRPLPLGVTLFLLGFFIVWFGFLAAIALTALYTVLWNLAGREVIEVSRQSVRLSRVVPGWTRTREYQSAPIRDLRVSPQTLPLFYRRQMSMFNLGDWRGQMAFDYGARTIRFADADEAEAKLILAEILRRFPQFAPAAGEATGQPAPAAQSW